MSKHCVIGLGEIGKALQEILKCDGEDLKIQAPLKHYDYLHIAFPYDDYFEKEVKKYQDKFTPKFTIVHSTVPIGTCEKLNAHHSPVRGVHPNLVDGILTFKKFLGGPQAFDIANELKKYRINCMCVREARHIEALKLIDTTQYGMMICINKEIYKWCQKNGVDYNIVYTLGNETYNDGYVKLFRPEVVRPHLTYMEGQIGGHCVLPNAKILERYSPIGIAKYILDSNKKF